MKRSNLAHEPLKVTTALGSFTLERLVNGRDKLTPATDHLRYLYSTSALSFRVEGRALADFVPERSAIKVQPGIEIAITMPRAAQIYSLTFQQDEQAIIDSLEQQHAAFFSTLPEDEQIEWLGLRNQPLDFISPYECNADCIQRIFDKSRRSTIALIAPPHSRRNVMSETGWLFLYSRGSKVLAYSSDVSFHKRETWKMHHHKIKTEIYVCHDGESDMIVNDEHYRMHKDDVLVAEPGDVHTMHDVPTAYYKGSTLQFPSIPGDKYEEKQP